MTEAIPSVQHISLVSHQESCNSMLSGAGATEVRFSDGDVVHHATSIAKLDQDKLKVNIDDPITSSSEAPIDGAVTTGGMRREWKFSLSFSHKAARLQVQWVPQWEPTFIDPSEIRELLGAMDPDVTHSPLIPFLHYTDLSGVVHGRPRYYTRSKTSSQPLNSEIGAADGGEELEKIGTSGNITGKQLEISEGVITSREAMHTSTDSASVLNECWVEKAKYVESYYAPIVPQLPTLHDFCLRCVKFVLAKMRVSSVDGDTNLRQLRLGSKLACPYRLGGRHSCFHFRFALNNKSELTNDIAYGIGTVVNQIGYFFVVRCADEEELCGYLTNLFLPYYTSKARLRLNVDVTYHEIPSVLLAEQQELFGELMYDDRDAAVSFYFPMYPMTLRPDFSPAKTVGVGSIACMTLDLHLHELLLEDPALEELTGLKRYALYEVVVCLDVEDVTRMNYPSVLSTDQFSELKMRRLLDVFPDATLSGPAATVEIGGRTGRSHLLTFFYEPMQCVVKAMVVSILVGSYGVTGLYLTKHRNGGFGMHLYLFQQLLMGVRYYEQKGARPIVVSRDAVPNVRLLEADLEAAYAHAVGTPEGAKMLARHLQLMREREAMRHDEGKSGAAIEVCEPSSGVRHGVSGESAEGAATEIRWPPSPHFKSDWMRKGMAAMMEDQSCFSSRASVNWVGGNVECDTLSIPHVVTTGAPHRRSYRLSDAKDFANNMAYFMSMSAQIYDAGSAFSGRENSIFTVPCGSILPEKTSGVVEVAGSVVVCGSDAEFAAVDLLHSQSLISVSCVPHLQDEYHDGTDNDEDPNAASKEGSPTAVFIRDESAGQMATLENLPTKFEATESGRSTSTRSGMSPNPCSLSHSPNYRMASSEAPLPFVKDESDRIDAVVGDTIPNFPNEANPAAELIPVSSSVEKSEMEEPNSVDGVELYLGPSLRDVYTHCCDLQHCRPNSHLVKKLPTDPHFTDSVQEIDLTSNYVGPNGFVAVLGFLKYLHSLRRVVFDDMSLNNVDAMNLCEALVVHPSVETVSLRNNPKITLPSTPHFSRLVKGNRRITCLELEGTLLGEAVVQRLAQAASNNKCPPQCNDVG
ncbi:unnamed protein product [Phytomonas sp. Hart1]|nr:unnamed protein product [Phytomonas sp. Hart1]|eukprot:CCW72093.1 unnamed protein product [Phytomonas sp. isolate Hart1]